MKLCVTVNAISRRATKIIMSYKSFWIKKDKNCNCNEYYYISHEKLIWEQHGIRRRAPDFVLKFTHEFKLWG